MHRFSAKRAELELSRRRSAAKRLAKRVKKPVSLVTRGPDPLVRLKDPAIKKISWLGLYLAVAIALHVGPVMLFWNVDFSNDYAPAVKSTPDRVVVRIEDPEPEAPELNGADRASEPSEAVVPKPVYELKEEAPKKTKRSPKPKKRTDIKSEALPSDWVDTAEKVAPTQETPRRRVVGISFESTVSGKGPGFAVGNTRMVQTSSRAADPNSVENLGPATEKAVSSRGSSQPNRKATLIPGKPVEFQKPKRLKEVSLEYPGSLKARGIEGNVVVMIRIDPSGKVRGVRILKSSGYAELDAAARRAASNEIFTPAKRNGEPVDYDLKYTYRFRIKTT